MGRFHAEKFARCPASQLAAVVDPDPAARADFRFQEGPGRRRRRGDRRADQPAPRSGARLPRARAARAGREAARGDARRSRRPGEPRVEEESACCRSATCSATATPSRRSRSAWTGALYIDAERLAGFKQRGAEVDVILDLMIHDLDLALSLARTEVSGVSACGFRVLTGDIDIATARIEFANGCVADLSASRVSQSVVRKFRVFEPGLYASADLQAGKLRYVRQEGGEIQETEEMHAGGDALAAQAESFVLAVTRESTRCGRRRGGPPRAQARPGDRPPGARAPGALRLMNKPIQMVDPAGEYRSLKAEIDAAVAARVRLRALRPRPRGRGARARDRAVRRRVARRRLQFRHRRAALSAGRRRHRAGRRSHHSRLHVLRHRRGGVLHRRDAGVRGCGRGHVQSRSCFSRRSITQEDQGGHCGPSVRPMRRPRRNRAHLQGEKASPGRRLRPVHRRRLPGQARGKLGRFRRLLVLSDQEPRRGRRRRPDHREHRGACQDAAHAAPPRQPPDLPARARGLEQPAGRAAGGGAAREAAPPRRLQRRAPRGGAGAIARSWPAPT